MEVFEVVVGATLKSLMLSFVDSRGNAIDITGGSVRLQGASQDLPSHNVDVAGVVYDGPNGLAQWTGLGADTYVSLANLNGRTAALYTLRGKFTSSVAQGSKVDFGTEFQIRWVAPPITS